MSTPGERLLLSAPRTCCVYQCPYGRWWIIAKYWAPRFSGEITEEAGESPLEVFKNPSTVQWPGPFNTEAEATHRLVTARLLAS